MIRSVHQVDQFEGLLILPKTIKFEICTQLVNIFNPRTYSLNFEEDIITIVTNV